MDLLPFVHMSAGGDLLWDLKFYYGAMPGADWHFVNAEGREVLTARQHRLRERPGVRIERKIGRQLPPKNAIREKEEESGRNQKGNEPHK